MLGYVIQRLLQAALVMLAMSALVFVGVYAIGNPIDVLISPGRDAGHPRGGDPPPTGSTCRCGSNTWPSSGGCCAGDFGQSFVFGMPVLDLILSRLPATLELALAAVLIGTLVGVPLGIYAGYRPDSVAVARRSWRCRCWASRCRPSGSG